MVDHLRGDLAACPPDLESRLAALTEISAMLEESRSCELVKGSTTGSNLGAICAADITAIPDSSDEIAELKRRFLAEIHAQDPDLFNYRTTWYDIRDRELALSPQAKDFYDQLTLVIDLRYNQIVCASFGAGAIEFVVDNTMDSARNLMNSTPSLEAELASRTVQIVPGNTPGDWFEWGELPEILSRASIYRTEQRRQAYISQILADRMVAEQQDRSLKLRLMLDVAPPLLNIVGGAVIGSMGDSLWTTAVGAIVGIASDAPTQRILEETILPRDRRSRREKILAEGIQTVVKADNRSWLQKIRRR
jgi:hypothetical protein